MAEGEVNRLAGVENEGPGQRAPGRHRVVHMTTVHQPYDVRIFHKECRTLSRSGYDVTLMVAQPCDEERAGIRLVRVATTRGRLSRMLGAPIKMLRLALREKADLYHFHDPELIPVGLCLKALGKRVIYDVHEELAQDICDKEWIPRPLRYPVAAVAYAVEQVAARIFDGIVVSRPALEGRFPRRKTVLANNFPILGELEQPSARRFSDRPPVCAYVGGINRERGLMEIVRALGALPDSVAFELHVAGLVEPANLVRELESMKGWARVRLLGWRSRSQVAELLNAARFGIVMFLPIANHVRSTPTKIFEYMSAGLPVLATDMPYWKQIIEKSGVGLTVDPKDTAALAGKLQWMIEHPEECQRMGATGFRLVHEKFNWGPEGARIIGLYEGLLQPRRRPVRS